MAYRLGGKRWTNWAGNVSSQPRDWAFPATAEELADLVRARRARGGRVKVVGSGHSFSPVAANDGATAVSLRQLKPDVAVDRQNNLVSVPGGMLLGEFVAALASNGLAPKNLGAVVGQTVAGAIATSTHGSGLGFGSLASLTAGFEFVSGTGEILTVSRKDHPDRWGALAVSLGSLGVITRITFACDPAFNLRLEQTPARLDETLERLDEHNRSRNFGFWWFSGSDRVLLRHFNLTDEPADPPQKLKRWFQNMVLRNVLHETLLLGSAFGLPVQAVNAAMVRAVFGKPSVRIGASADIVTSKIRIAQHVMEFALPYEAAKPAMVALRRLIETSGFPAHSPVDMRFAGPDDAWLGLSHGRRTCFIGIVVYQPYGKHVDSEPYFRAVDRLMREFDGRPHWGKIHYHDHADLAPKYGRWDDFQAMRENLDPGRVFANPYLDRVLGR